MSDDESWAAYATDADEALSAIEQALLVLETTTDMAVIHSLYRGLHTIKGNSGFLHLRSIERVAHAAESLVGLVRDEGRAIDATLIELLLQLVDLLRRLIAAAADARGDVDDDDVAPLVARATALTGSSLPETRDDGVHLFDDDPADAFDGADAGLDEDGFFRALAQATLAALDTGGDDALRALADLTRAAERRGDLGLAAALSACSAPLTPEGIAAIGSALRDAGVRVDVDAPKSASATPAAASSTTTAATTTTATTTTTAATTTTTTAATTTTATTTTTAATTTATAREEATLRIDGSKATQLMALTGELGLAVHAVTRHPGIAADALEGFQAAAHRLENLVTELQNEAAGLRLVPIAGVFARMRRVVRDTCVRTGKEADLIVVGEDTEIDKALVDRLHDPLVHVLRNAIDHGLESPDERERVGKARRGRIVLHAAHRGGAVEIAVIDDGAGVNVERVRARAIERGFCAQGAVLSDAEVIEFLFTPGFSTAPQVTELSGRGVGLDVMRSTIESMRGSVHIRSTPGAGMRLEITLPLTVAFLEAMVVRSHGWLLAVPIEKVHHVERLPQARFLSDPASATLLAHLDDGLVPVVQLDRFFHASPADDAARSDRLVVVVNSQRGRVAFPVDKLVGNQQVMLKPINGLLQNIRASSGYGVLRSGEVALTLDCERLHAS